MHTTKETLKAYLLKHYESQLERLLEHINPADELDLSEIEAAALAIRQQVGADISQVLVNSQTQPKIADEPCPTCGGRMRYKGQKGKTLRSRSGDLEIERAYYYCPSCKAGYFPP